MLARAQKKLGGSRMSGTFWDFGAKLGHLQGRWVGCAPVAVSGSFSGIPVLSDVRKGSALWRIGGLFRTLRPSQLVGKNAFVLAPIVFAKELTSPALLTRAGIGFAVFCCLAGAVYTLNDIVDAPADRAHPVKRWRA